MDRARLVNRVFFTAIAIGAVSAALLAKAEWGLNIALIAILTFGAGYWCLKDSPIAISRSSKLMIGCAIVFASLFAFRDATGLQVANGFAIITALGCALAFARSGGIANAPISRVFGDSIGKFLTIPMEFSRHAKEVKFPNSDENGQRKIAASTLRGLLISAPLLLVFGGLFYSADAMFKSGVDNLFNFNLDFEFILQYIFVFLCVWVGGGGVLSRFILSPYDYPPMSGKNFIGPPKYGTPPTDPNKQKIGVIEVNMALGSLVALFASFIAVQFRYLFAGNQTIVTTAGLSYAEYARSGFFQLCWVAGLALLVVLGIDSIKLTNGRLYTWLTRSLIVLVFFVIASAGLRMKIYTDAFGLTELRLYTSAFMGWLAITFAWLLPTITANRPNRFSFGAILAGFTVIFGLNLLNPEGLITRTNLSHQKPDINYLQYLSADATRVMRSSEQFKASKADSPINQVVTAEIQNDSTDDWRSLNLSKFLLKAGR